GDGTVVEPLSRYEATVPLRLTLGETLVEVERPDDVSREQLATLAQPARPSLVPQETISLDALGEAPSADRLASWFETVLAVQGAPPGSPEFYQQTAKALVERVGLDRALVLLRRGERWEVAARVAASEGGFGRDFSAGILRHVVTERRTFYQGRASGDLPPTESLAGIEAVVASPFFDTSGNVVGVLYGSRARLLRLRGPGISNLEAQVVQVLASTLGAGLARLEREAAAARLRVQFEQFFSPALARELERDPKLLEGRQREVTVLFSDIRGFSRLAERLAPTAPADLCRLVAEVMDCLTKHVRETEGVVVDYYGDGMCAMWNAPFDQPDHAARACRAALAVLAELPTLSAAWQDRVGGPLSVGLGLNSGVAMVGNTGSSQKMKYGPFGHTVNLASRTEGATKHLGVSALMTGATRALIGDGFAVRRLCRARLAGVGDPVDLYELHGEPPDAAWEKDREAYEEALKRYEAGQFAAACQGVYALLAGRGGRYDVPALNLISRAVECLKPAGAKFDAVWEFTSK
ncbi:MAG TPA: adenylate/guanylate cyclase domain-containing protein, partial [Gemmataceae bacterium]|nr:adenylate/guanylate cyclase domain-containing protein [Gemmataceae bacterium]